MSLSASRFSQQEFEMIQSIVSENASGLPMGLLSSGIIDLQGPVLEYVSKYIPAEYDSSFEDIDTWINTLSDLVLRRSCAGSSVQLSGEDSSMVSRDRCLSSSEKASHYSGRIRIMDPFRRGTRPLVLTEFRKTIAVVLVILLLAMFVKEDNPAMLFAVEKISEKKQKIYEALINKYMSMRDEAEKRRENYRLTGDVEYLD